MRGNPELWRYRAEWKQGAYEAFATGEWTAFTLTLSDLALETLFSEAGLRMRIDRWMADQNVSGLVIVETSRSGRLHAHGIARGGFRPLMPALEKWKADQGRVDMNEGTDLMGWITYMFKAFGPETQWVWKGTRQHGLAESL